MNEFHRKAEQRGYDDHIGNTKHPGPDLVDIADILQESIDRAIAKGQIKDPGGSEKLTDEEFVKYQAVVDIDRRSISNAYSRGVSRAMKGKGK